MSHSLGTHTYTHTVLYLHTVTQGCPPTQDFYIELLTQRVSLETGSVISIAEVLR